MTDKQIKAIEEVKDIIEEVKENTKQEIPTYIFDRDIKCLPIVLNLIIKQQKEIEKHKNTIARYEMESKSFRAFCRKIRKTEKRNVDEFNQGREYSYIQFLNLINGEQNWEHEGKHFDEVDEELEKWVERK